MGPGHGTNRGLEFARLGFTPAHRHLGGMPAQISLVQQPDNAVAAYEDAFAGLSIAKRHLLAKARAMNGDLMRYSLAAQARPFAAGSPFICHSHF